MQTPFFTVGIPTYNRAGLLMQAVQGVLGQSCEDFELIVADNHSTDDTPQVMARLKDPRIRYVRHEQNLGIMGNFQFLATQARGRYFVLHQDDDLLHRDFLARCRQAVDGEEGVAMYATAWWRGSEQSGFECTLAADPGLLDAQAVLADRPLLSDGAGWAVRLLYRFYFANPAIAYNAEILRQIGGYPQTNLEGVVDIMLAARLLCRGKLAFDPRIGAVYRDHGANYSRSMSRGVRRHNRRKLYDDLTGLFESHQIDWPSLLSRQLVQMSETQLFWVMNQWIRNQAPRRIQDVMWRELKRRYAGAPIQMWRRLISRLGLGKTVKSAWMMCGSGG